MTCAHIIFKYPTVIFMPVQGLDCIHVPQNKEQLAYLGFSLAPKASRLFTAAFLFCTEIHQSSFFYPSCERYKHLDL